MCAGGVHGGGVSLLTLPEHRAFEYKCKFYKYCHKECVQKVTLKYCDYSPLKKMNNKNSLRLHIKCALHFVHRHVSFLVLFMIFITNKCYFYSDIFISFYIFLYIYIFYIYISYIFMPRYIKISVIVCASASIYNVYYNS